MLFALVLQDPELTRQPTLVEVVEYQRVQHALPNGAPDPKAPDNFYIRVVATWHLLGDTDTVEPDANGVRRLSLPRFDHVDYARFSEEGGRNPKLAARFNEVFPPADGKRFWKRGEGSFSATDIEVPARGRQIRFYVRTVAERVERHTEGKRWLLRSQKETYWSVNSTAGLSAGKPFLPRLDSTFAAEPLPHVRVDAPRIAYGKVERPKDELF